MTDIPAPQFDLPATARLWEDYLSRASALTQPLAKSQRHDILLEVRAHLLESMLNKTGDETQRLQAAQHNLGAPEEFIPGWVQGRLEQSADPALVLHSRWQLLRLNSALGLRGLLKSMLHGFGHMLVFYSYLMAILNLFYPDNVGFYTSSSGWPFIGFVDAAEFTEHLGYWFIPVMFLFGSGMLWLLNHRSATRR